MTTARDIVIYQGQAFALSLPYAGTAGRGQRMHIRTATAAATVIQILTHNGDANARVLFDGTDAIDITIGASFSALWLVGADRVEWVYDIEDYALADDDDVVITHRGKCVVYGNRTRESDVTPSEQMPSGDGRYVRFDGVQALTTEQQEQGRDNLGIVPGSGDGDVVGPASATDDRIAAFDGVTGKLIKQGTVTATAVASHIGSTSNPHSVTAAQVGADPAGTATGAVSTHNSVTTAHGISAFGATLVDDADASTARTTLGLGTAATSASGDFAAASHAHAASAITSGTLAHERGGLEADVSAYTGLVKIAAGATSAVTVTAAGEALLDDADASAQRTTLGLGTAATTASTDYATAAQGTDDRTASGLRSATTVVSVSAATAPSSGQVLTATGSAAATWQDPIGGSGTDTFCVRSPLDNEPPASAFATLDTRNSTPCLDFDAAADESAIFSGFAPEGIVLTSGIIARIVWAATSATSGNVRWRVAFERRTTDQDADSFDTATEATDATNATSGICEACEITCTTIDSIVAGDSFRVRVTRVGTDGTEDTMTGDAELFGFELRAA